MALAYLLQRSENHAIEPFRPRSLLMRPAKEMVWLGGTRNVRCFPPYDFTQRGPTLLRQIQRGNLHAHLSDGRFQRVALLDQDLLHLRHRRTNADRRPHLRRGQQFLEA